MPSGIPIFLFAKAPQALQWLARFCIRIIQLISRWDCQLIPCQGGELVSRRVLGTTQGLTAIAGSPSRCDALG